MTSKQTNTFREEIENIIIDIQNDGRSLAIAIEYGEDVEEKEEYGIINKRVDLILALFQKVVDKACNENDVTYYYFGPRDYEMAKMNVIETKKRIRASFKNIVEGKESI